MTELGDIHYRIPGFDPPASHRAPAPDMRNTKSTSHLGNVPPAAGVIRPERRLVRVSLDDIQTAEIEPPPFVVENRIPRGEVTLFGSHGGKGKTILMLAIAAHVAAGKRWAGLTVEQGKAVFISLEDPAQLIRYRVRRIIAEYDLDAELVAQNLAIFDGSDADAALVIESSQHGNHVLVDTPTLVEVEEAASGAVLIVIDNASDAYDGDEIRRRSVRHFIRRLRRIARREFAGLVLLAHIDKASAKGGSQGNSYSGSTAWHNSVRSRLALVGESPDHPELHQEKNNLGPLADPVLLSWAGTVIVPRIRNRVLEAAAADSAAGDDAQAVLNVIRIAIESGAAIPAAMSGSFTVASALEPYAELPASLKGSSGRKRVYAATVALLRAGKLVRVEYLNSHRHKRERLELAQRLTQSEPK